MAYCLNCDDEIESGEDYCCEACESDDAERIYDENFDLQDNDFDDEPW